MVFVAAEDVEQRAFTQRIIAGLHAFDAQLFEGGFEGEQAAGD